VPFLKFARDRRGYESTFLVHTSRQAGPSRLLYWFRSPPHIKIGRAAFDEDAIRLLEQQHPGVEFDWDRILTTRPPAAPEPKDLRDSRARARPDRRPARDVRREPPPRAASPPAPALPPVPEQRAAPPAPPPSVLTFPPVAPVLAPAPMAAPPPSATPVRRFVRVLDAPGPVHHATEPAVVERMLGAERLTMLRARHAEILARISARGGDPARVEALREQAERVNPDAWVTETDVNAGLATLDATLAELHRIVGRRRRRRRRREAGDTTAANASGALPIDAAAPVSPEPDALDIEEDDEADGE
jgi:hypothetical protein